MKLTKKQIEALASTELYIPLNVDWDSLTCRYSSYPFAGLDAKTQSDKDGISPEEAFFMKTEKGITPKKIKDVPRFVSLIFGHKRRSLEINNIRI